MCGKSLHVVEYGIFPDHSLDNTEGLLGTREGAMELVVLQWEQFFHPWFFLVERKAKF